MSKNKKLVKTGSLGEIIWACHQDFRQSYLTGQLKWFDLTAGYGGQENLIHALMVLRAEA